MNLVFFCEKYIKETQSGQFVCKTTSFRLFFDYNYATQMRHAALCVPKMSSDASSESEMPYDSSDEEVWEEEEVSGDDDSDGGPGFLDPTQQAPGLHVV